MLIPSTRKDAGDMLKIPIMKISKNDATITAQLASANSTFSNSITMIGRIF